MNWQDLKNWKTRLRVGNRVRRAPFQIPTLALEMQPGFVAGARLNADTRCVERVGVRELEAGALNPSPNKPNVTNGVALRRTVGEVAGLFGNASERLGVLIPDLTARAVLLEFDALPENRQDAEALTYWRLREFLPFNPDEAHVCYQVLSKQPGSVEILAMALQGSVQAEYEAALEGVNGRPVLVLPASVALLPLLPEDSSAQLLLHLCPGSLTAVAVELNRVRYWRTRELENGGKGGPEEVAREAKRVLATCQDHLKLAVQQVWFCARPPELADMKNVLAKTLGRELRSLPGALTPSETTPAGEGEAWQHFGTPFAGLVANLEERP